MCRAAILVCLCALLSFTAPAWSRDDVPWSKRVLGPAPATQTSASKTETETDISNRVNDWTVTILGGYLSGEHIKMAADLETVLSDGDNLRIMPVVSQGAKQNVLDLLFLQGADLAFTHADVLAEFKKEGVISNIDNRIQYISQVHVSALNILARPEIKSIKDLSGKKVGFHGRGTGIAVTAPIVLGRLGIAVEPVYINNTVALEKMKSGELAALVHLLPRNSEFFTQIPADTGFHLLSVNYDSRFADYYLPYTLEQNDYPNLIKPGETVRTLGVPAVLAVYNWPKDSEHYRRVERFVQYYFRRFNRLDKAPFQREWKNVNLAAKVPGWKRYAPAEEALAKLVRNELAGDAADTDAEPQPNVPADIRDPKQRELFKEYQEWKRKRLIGQ